MRSQRWIFAVWACFLARLLFYSAMLPLWEGYDEWAHFAVVRQMAIGGHLLVSRDAPVPRDVEASLQLAPVPWELRTLGPPSVTQDEYWGLTRDERERRGSTLRTMPAAWSREDSTGALKAYEALQPPLYYWIMAPALWLYRGAGFFEVLRIPIVAGRNLEAADSGGSVILVNQAMADKYFPHENDRQVDCHRQSATNCEHRAQRAHRLVSIVRNAHTGGQKLK